MPLEIVKNGWNALEAYTLPRQQILSTIPEDEHSADREGGKEGPPAGRMRMTDRVIRLRKDG